MDDYEGFIGHIIPYERKICNANPIIRKLAWDRINIMVDMCGDVKGKSVADLACEVGYEALKLVKKGALVWGLDNEQKMLDMAEIYIKANSLEVYSNRFIPVLGNIESPPFPDNFFDITLAGCILPHLFYPDHALKEMIRITKPNGRIVINFSNDPMILVVKRALPFLFPRLDKGLAKEHLWMGCQRFLKTVTSPYSKNLKQLEFRIENLHTQIYASYQVKK